MTLLPTPWSSMMSSCPRHPQRRDRGLRRPATAGPRRPYGSAAHRHPSRGNAPVSDRDRTRTAGRSAPRAACPSPPTRPGRPWPDSMTGSTRSWSWAATASGRHVSTSGFSPTSPLSRAPGCRGSRPLVRRYSPPPGCSTATRRPRTGHRARSPPAIPTHVRPDRIYVHDRTGGPRRSNRGRRSLPRHGADRPRRSAGAPGGGVAGRVRAATWRSVAVQRPATSPTRHDVDCRAAGLARRPPRREPRGGGAGGPGGHEPAHVRTRVPSRDGTTPAAFVEELRVESARRLLETTELTVAAVAARAGGSSMPRPCTAFHRRLGTTPDRYRQHFSRRAS